jgi:hypothetical protein
VNTVQAEAAEQHDIEGASIQTVSFSFPFFTNNYQAFLLGTL